jgi:N-methylhydantoinase A
VYALNSGPAAGPSAGSHYAKLYDRDVITADAGGTSFDVGLVHAGETDVRLTSDVARYRIGIPLVNVETLGAGGGSIARIDSRGLLAVGPESAEADPGPACYALGGMEPTVTDALVVLGYLSRVALLGGRMPIDAPAAIRAVEQSIADPLGISVEEAAFGIVRVASGNMVGGMRRVSIERGYDARDAVLVAVGGVGPAFACRLADELEMSPVVVPRVASGFCAFGAVVADLRHDYLTTYTVPLGDADLDRLNVILGDLESRGRDELARDARGGEIEIEIKRTLELRYIDQLHNCRVPMPPADKVDAEVLAAVREAFDRRHEALYTYCEPDNDVLLVTVHCSVIGRRGWDTSQFRSAPGRPAAVAEERSRSVYWGASGNYDDVSVLLPADLAGGDAVRGPLIVSEETTTIVVEPGWEIRLDERDFYELASTARARGS